ncbi:MAG: hypothetical protein JO189_08460 [Deltaproteobacteria bacterium]|nr:hypothetical protein [Deltaproteobacteria bacterium]
MKIRNFLGLPTWLLLSIAAVPGAIAAPIACPTTGTYQDLLNSNAGGGCTLSVGGGASLTFLDFAYTPSGVDTPTAAGMSYALDNPGVDQGVPIFGFEFRPGLSVTGTAVQTIALSYLVVPSGTAITSAHLAQTATASGGGVGQVSENLMFCIAGDPNNTSGMCRTFGGNPLTVSTSGSSSDVANFGAWTSMTVAKTIMASSGSAGGTAAITQVRDSVDLVTPEPTAYGLLGMGLLVAGYFARHRTG